jgi:hypothetical protein
MFRSNDLGIISHISNDQAIFVRGPYDFHVILRDYAAVHLSCVDAQPMASWQQTSVAPYQNRLATLSSSQFKTRYSPISRILLIVEFGVSHAHT